MNERRPDHVYGVLLLGLMGIGLSGIFVRYSGAPSLFTATWRLGFTVLILAVLFTLRRGWGELRGLKAGQAVWCALSGVCLALHFTFWFESLRYTTVAASTVLVCTEVLFVAVGDVLFCKGRMSGGCWAAIGISLVGSAVIALGDGALGGSLEGALYGDALALAAAFFVGAYTLIGRVQRASLSTNTYTFVVYSFCLLTLLVMDLATGTPVVGLPLREFLPPLALAVCSTLLGHSLFSYCLKYFPPAYVSAVKLAEPIIAAIVAVPCFGEWPSAATVAGGALILLSLLFYTRQETAR